jgi:hypothetical protein
MAIDTRAGFDYRKSGARLLSGGLVISNRLSGIFPKAAAHH